MNLTYVSTTLLALCLSQVTVPVEKNVLVDFGDKQNSSGWNVVNDGVMGGRSVGKVRLTDDGVMNFSGTLSLDNNGGFSSIRSGPIDVQMAIEDGMKAIDPLAAAAIHLMRHGRGTGLTLCKPFPQKFMPGHNA